MPDMHDSRDIDARSGPAANLTLDWDVVITNTAWPQVFAGLEPGGNLIQWVCLHPRAVQMPHWRRTARQLLLWYLAGIRRHGSNGRAAAILHSCAAENPAVTPLLIDPDPAELDRAWTDTVPITTTDAAGRHDVYEFQVSTPVAFDLHTGRILPPPFYSMAGVSSTGSAALSI
ncbi:hypothetical protein [Nocardia sp. NPDC052566]|uniref:MmyB family transcriptional regulator n=1 Tax=Nocardia sp. NPDC052566 TaxID=3364330 RepID=UPI0037C622D3